MTDPFAELKAKAEALEVADKQATQNWFKKYRLWLIAIAAVSLLFLAIGKGWL